MWFNILTENHGRVETLEPLAPLIRYMREAIGACGHDVTIVHDQVYPDAVNLFLEQFVTRDYAKGFTELRSRGIAIGVVATELMVGGKIPYERYGVSFGGKRNEEKARLRVERFEAAVDAADFLWSILERNHLEYKDRVRVAEFFPVGSTREIPLAERRSPKDIDVVFFGRATPHRAAVLNALAGTGLTLVIAGRGTPGGWLPSFMVESLLDRAKIGLNLNLHGLSESADGIDPRFASAMRIKEMLERGVCIVSEEIPLCNPYADLMISAPAEEIATTCRRVIRSGEWESFGAQAMQRFRREMKAADICAPVIGRTLQRIGKGP